MNQTCKDEARESATYFTITPRSQFGVCLGVEVANSIENSLAQHAAAHENIVKYLLFPTIELGYTCETFVVLQASWLVSV